MFGEPSNARLALFELMRAVNERQAAVGSSKTAFRKADGTTGADLTMSDIAGISAVGGFTGTNYAYQNLLAVQLWITQNARRFTTTDSSETIWGVSGLSTAVGYDLNTFPKRIASAAHWQAIQDALDLLVYPWGYLVDPSPTWQPATKSDVESNVSDAWAGRADNSHSPTIGDRVGVKVDPADDAGNWLATITPEVDLAYSEFIWGDILLGAPIPRPIVGVVNSAYAVYRKNGAQISSSVAFTIGGNSDSVSNGTSMHEVAVTEPDLTGADPVLNIEFTVPSSSPFNEESHPTMDFFQRRAQVDYSGGGRFPVIKIYFDISAELTDQA